MSRKTMIRALMISSVVGYIFLFGAAFNRYVILEYNPAVFMFITLNSLVIFGVLWGSYYSSRH